MKRFKYLLVFILAVMMLTQTALAATCNISFTANGKTYHAIHHPEGTGYFTVLGDHPYITPMDHDPNPEYEAYDRAYQIATMNHVATCPHYALGDESIPLYLLCAAAVLAAIGAVAVHKKRMNLS